MTGDTVVAVLRHRESKMERWNPTSQEIVATREKLRLMLLRLHLLMTQDERDTCSDVSVLLLRLYEVRREDAMKESARLEAFRRLGKDLIREAEERGAKWAIDATDAAYTRMNVQKGLQPLDPVEVCEDAREMEQRKRKTP